jgi:hypothetical protein
MGRPTALSKPEAMAAAPRIKPRLIREAVVENCAELARLGQVTPARISQILALLYLAPDIQEAILFLPRTVRAPAPNRPRLEDTASLLGADPASETSPGGSCRSFSEKVVPLCPRHGTNKGNNNPVGTKP